MNGYYYTEATRKLANEDWTKLYNNWFWARPSDEQRRIHNMFREAGVNVQDKLVMLGRAVAECMQEEED